MSPPLSLRAATAAAASLCILAATACGEEFPEIRYETEHLRIGTTFDAPLCRGDLEHYEQVIANTEQLLATTVNQAVEVYLWNHLESTTSPGWCSSSSANGCFEDGIVYADHSSIDHELVHAVVATFAEPTRFWNEGAAEALQSAPTVFGSSAPVDNLDLVAPQLSYSTAGHFSRWLLETYGLDRYRELLRAPGSSREAFESTYGMSVEDAQEQYLAEAPHSYGALLSCDHPDLPQTGEHRWSEAVEVDCSSPDVRSVPTGMGVYRVLTISERGFYELSTTAEAGVIKSCYDEERKTPISHGDPDYGDVPPASGGFAQLFAGEGGKPVLELVPGRYEIAVGHAGHEPRSAELEVRAAPGPVPQTPESQG